MANVTVLPEGWSKRHQPIAEAFLTAECVIDRQVVNPPDNNGETWPSTPATTRIYGMDTTKRICRFQSKTGADQAKAAEESIMIRRYLVAIPAGYPGGDNVRPGDVITITACKEDPGAVGKTFVIRAVTYANERFQRDLFCHQQIGTEGP